MEAGEARKVQLPATLKPAVKDFRHPSEDTIATDRGDGDAVNTDGWVGGREGEGDTCKQV